MLGKCSYFRTTRAMQGDLGFLNSFCYLEPLSITLKCKKSEILGLVLIFLQNDDLHLSALAADSKLGCFKYVCS